MTEPMRLFVYGTLRDPELVRRITGRTFPTEPASLPGWRLVSPAQSRSGYPEIVPDPEGCVPGLLLHDLDPASLHRLDAYEEGYVRRQVRVRTGSGLKEAEVYVPAYVLGGDPASRYYGPRHARRDPGADRGGSMGRNRAAILWMAGLVTLLLAFSAGYALGSRTGVAAADPRNEGLRMLQALSEALDRQYIRKDLDWRALYDGAARGMLQALDDPYTAFFDAQGFRRFQEDFRGYFFGIGIFIEKQDRRLLVVAPIENTPAWRAGLRPGDHITHIDGTPTAEMPIEEAVARIRGPQGTQVRLRIQRGERTFEVTIVRDRIEITSVQGEEALSDRERGLLQAAGLSYIRILAFNQDTSERFARHMQRVRQARGAGLVLDLRSSPGGLVDQCTRVADFFVPSGPILYEVDRNGRMRTIYATAREKYRKPVAVLVNEGTASCSEILAGALQDTGTAVLVGQRTFGKGVITSVVDLPGGRGATITTAKYLTPKKRDIHRKGIQPDIVAGDRIEGKTPQELEAIRFEQLRKAVDALRRR
mgnify:CR=1 FL=1